MKLGLLFRSFGCFLKIFSESKDITARFHRYGLD